MHRITQLGVVSFAKILGISGAMVGLIAGVGYGLIIIMASAIGGATVEEGGAGLAAMGIGGGLIVMLALPIIAGIFYFVVGLIYGLILNLVLSLSGGLEVRIEAPGQHKS